jgi:hypothetical protein
MTRILLGDDYDAVHAWKDEPVKRRGANHREVRHGPLAAYKVGKKFQGSGRFNLGAPLASIIHDLQGGHPTTWLTVIGALGLGYLALKEITRGNPAQNSTVTQDGSIPIRQIDVPTIF